VVKRVVHTIYDLGSATLKAYIRETCWSLVVLVILVRVLQVRPKPRNSNPKCSSPKCPDIAYPTPDPELTPSFFLTTRLSDPGLTAHALLFLDNKTIRPRLDCSALQ